MDTKSASRKAKGNDSIIIGKLIFYKSGWRMDTFIEIAGGKTRGNEIGVYESLSPHEKATLSFNMRNY